MEKFIGQLNDIIWSNALIFLCLGAGVLFSLRTRFLQVRLLKQMLNLLFKGGGNDAGISSFQALTVSLSGRVGLGNIAGVSAAIAFGGPGSIFWMWVVAFLGASTAYVESTLGQIYKEIDPITGQYRGGPAFYFEKCLGGIGWKIYGILFAIAAIVACGLFLPGVQSNGIISAITSEQVFGTGPSFSTSPGFGDLGVNTMAAIAAVVLLFGLIIFGGIKRIAQFSQVAVPFMALGYILLAVVILIVRYDEIIPTLKMIVNDAFNAKAGIGAAIGWGVKRGVYSSEAGQGTGPHPAAAAEVDHPAQQGLVQAFSVYIDTLFVCTATALMILITQKYNVYNSDNEFIIQNVPQLVASTPEFTQAALASIYGNIGKYFVAIAVFFFAFTTILAYYYIAETNIVYLSEKMGLGGSLLFVNKIVMIASVTYGGLSSSGYIWTIGDIGVGIMAWFNIVGIIGLFFLARPAVRALKDYEQQLRTGTKQFVFDPQKNGIKNATFWEERLRNAK